MCFPQMLSVDSASAKEERRRSILTGSEAAAAAAEAVSRAGYRLGGLGLHLSPSLTRLLPPFLLPTKMDWHSMMQYQQKLKGAAEQTVISMSDLVVRLNLTFTKLVLPIIFLIFLSILHSHREIQVVVCSVVGGIIVFAAVLNGGDFMKRLFQGSSKLFGFGRSNKVDPNDGDFAVPGLSIKMATYKVLPNNRSSRMWGRIADTRLPPPLNYLTVWLFATICKCDRSEAEHDSIFEYKTISQFFRRRLKPGLRPICQDSDLVSPADGFLTYAGEVTGDYLQQEWIAFENVKGINYSLKQFFGPLQDIRPGASLKSCFSMGSMFELSDDSGCVSPSVISSPPSMLRLTVPGEEDKPSGIAGAVGGYDDVDQLLHDPVNNALYQAVVYLSPADYHRFHSPADWVVEKRRHFPGKLYSVAPRMAASMPGLFHTNERVAFFGRWRHGFFSLTAVGATNVGSIGVNFEPDLATNLRGRRFTEKIYFTDDASQQVKTAETDSAAADDDYNNGGSPFFRSFSASSLPPVGTWFDEKNRGAAAGQRQSVGISLKKGEEFGYFNFGSTVVLVFEAPKRFGFQKAAMERVKVGQGLGQEGHLSVGQFDLW